MAIRVTKHRTQIYLTDDQYRKVKKIAKKQEASLAEVVRDAISKYAMADRGEDDKVFARDRDEFFKLAGIFKGPKNLAKNHDEYWDYP